MRPEQLTQNLKREALRLGFNLAGACSAVAPPGQERFRQWIASGFAGEMRFLTDRAQAYEHPRHVLEGVRSILVLAAAYCTRPPRATEPGQGRVSRYAWGDDYHHVIRRRLRRLEQLHREWAPSARVRGVVDTAPIFERELGQLAGLGWIGKNTLLLNPGMGSWFFLAALLTSDVLAYDEPFPGSHCGTCRACLEACPTGALVEPYRLDARKCISYLTIELRGSAPRELRPAMGQWLFGCDVCQEVCPWNRRAAASIDRAFQPRADTDPVELAELFFLDAASWRARFRGTSLWRPKRRGLLRNAAIVLGNRPHRAALPALVRGLGDAEPLVRAACAWALRRYPEREARAALDRRAQIECDAAVLAEIRG